MPTHEKILFRKGNIADITAIAEIVPESESKNAGDASFPKISEPTNTRNNAMSDAFHIPSVSIATRMTIYENPGFNHGIGRGMNSSIIHIANESAVRMEINANFLCFSAEDGIVFSPSLIAFRNNDKPVGNANHCLTCRRNFSAFYTYPMWTIGFDNACASIANSNFDIA